MRGVKSTVILSSSLNGSGGSIKYRRGSNILVQETKSRVSLSLEPNIRMTRRFGGVHWPPSGWTGTGRRQTRVKKNGHGGGTETEFEG